MDELAILQAQLEAVQKMDTKYKLSERNCVEVVTKLMKKGKIKLVNTLSNSREFLTFPQLEIEIRDELQANGGRISATQLKEAINVDIAHVESKIREIASRDSKVSLLPPHENEIITSWYLDNIASDVASHLEQHGSSDVAKLAMEFDLPVDFLRSVLDRHVGLEDDATIRGTISSSGKILTESSVRRLCAKLRGVFNGTAKPLSLDKVASRLSAERKVVMKQAKEMIDSGRLKGTIQHGTFYPAIFRVAQSEEVRTYFSSQGYCTFARAAKMSIKKKELASFLGGSDSIVMLSTAAIDENKIKNAEKIVTDVLTSGKQFVSTASLFPEDLTERDVATCVDRFEISNGSWRNGSSKGKAFACCQGMYILSCDFLDTCVSKIQEREKNLIASGDVMDVISSKEDEDYVIVSTSFSSSNDHNTTTQQKNKKNNNSNNKKKKDKRKGKRRDDEELEEVEDARKNSKRGGNKKKKKRKNKKGRRGNYSDDEEEEEGEQHLQQRHEKRKTKKEDPNTSWLLNAKKLKVGESIVKSLCPEMMEHTELLQVVMRLVLPYAASICVALRSEASRAVYRESIDSQRKLRGDSEKQFAILWESVLLHKKSIDRFLSLTDDKDKRESIRKSLEHALLTRGQGIEAVSCLIGVPLPPHTKLVDGKPLLSEEERESIVRDVQKQDATVGAALRTIHRAASSQKKKSDLESIFNTIENLKTCGRCYVRPPEMPRKREKHLLHVRKKNIYSEMSADVKDTTEQKASRILRLILLYAKDSIALPPTDLDLTVQCYGLMRSLDDTTDLWGSSRSESVCTALDDLKGVFSSDDDDDDADLSSLLTVLVAKK